MGNLAPAADWEPRYAGRAERMRASEIRELLKLLDKPGVISFAGGIPDPALFPVAGGRRRPTRPCWPIRQARAAACNTR